MALAASWSIAVSAASADSPRPVVDVDFLYHQLYYMSTNYLYRVSGQVLEEDDDRPEGARAARR